MNRIGKNSKKPTASSKKPSRNQKDSSKASLSRLSFIPAVKIPGTKAVEKVLLMKPDKLRHVGKRAPATAKDYIDQMLEMSIGARGSASKFHKLPDGPDMEQGTNPTSFHGNLSNHTLVRENDKGIPGPINLDFEVREVGSSLRLDQYKKEYPKTSIDIPVPSLRSNASGYSIQEFSQVGFNRANVHWPYLHYDHYTSSVDQLSWKQSNFNRYDIQYALVDLFRRLSGVRGTSTESQFENQFLDFVSDLGSGDESYLFPVDSIDTIYTIQNRSSNVPIYISVYINTPTQHLRCSDTPMSNWFQPIKGQNKEDPSTLMDSSYFFNPIITADQDVITDSTLKTTSNMDNKDHIICSSSEVLNDATPFFSARFRENWEVRHVKKIRLLPQQVLNLKVKTVFSKPLNLKELLSEESTPLHRFANYKNLSIFPMFKFWGEKVSGESNDLGKTGVKNRNLFTQSVGPKSGPGMISVDRTRTIVFHLPEVPLKNIPQTSKVFQDILFRILPNFSTKGRELVYNMDRGISFPYHRVNENISFFTDVNDKPSQTLTTNCVVELNKDRIFNTGQNAPITAFTFGDLFLDWGRMVIEVISKEILQITSPNVQK